MATKPTTLEIVSPAKAENLTALANEINATHNVAKSHAQLAVVFAIRTGLLCIRAKDAIEHGAFGEWADKHLTVGSSTRAKYMALAKGSLGALPESAAASDAIAASPVAELIDADFIARIEKDTKYRDAVAEKVRDVVGEGSLSDLYKDYGITHGPKNVDPETNKRIHYPATKAKKLSPEQLAKQNRAAAKAQFITVLGNLKTVIDDKQVRRWLDPKDWIEIQKLAQDRLKAISTIADKAAAALAKGGK